MIKVAVTDDHVLMRRGIVNALKQSSDIEIIIEAENGKVLIDSLNDNNLPDVVLLDIQMPVMDGYETLDYLHQNHPEVKVIILSMIQDPLAENNLKKRGANEFLSKSISTDDLISTVINIHKKHATDICFENANEEKYEALSDKEIELLRYCPTGLTYEQIAEAMLSSTKTLDRYRIELFRKLKVQSRAELAAIAVKMGLII